MKITIKPDSDDEDPNKLYNLLRNGLSGEYVLQSITKDKFKGEYNFNFIEKRKE
jgi:hypothetical protein